MNSLAVSAAPKRPGRQARRHAGLRILRDPDRVARGRANRRGRPGGFSDEELLRGVRKVAARLGHPPAPSEYERLARELGLARAQTVRVRFGGWCAVLKAAGMGSVIAGRVYAPGWHLAACWRAVQSVANELGDPPRYRRYAELAAGREDLPSATTVRVRLGPWTGIAAALRDGNGRPSATRNARNMARPKNVLNPKPVSPPRVEGRVLTVRAARTLAHLRAHSGTTGTAVRAATGIRDSSQARKLLARLERQGMVTGQRVGRAKAWSLTEQGRAALKGLPEGPYE